MRAPIYRGQCAQFGEGLSVSLKVVARLVSCVFVPAGNVPRELLRRDSAFVKSCSQRVTCAAPVFKTSSWVYLQKLVDNLQTGVSRRWLRQVVCLWGPVSGFHHWNLGRGNSTREVCPRWGDAT